MFKKISALIVSLAMVFSVAAMTGISASAEDTFTLKVHYNRTEADYDGWNLWVWYDTVPGVAYEFTGEDDFGKFAEIPMAIDPATAKVQIIVRRGEWEEKDFEGDRVIDVTKGDGKSVEIFINQGVEEFKYADAAAPAETEAPAEETAAPDAAAPEETVVAGNTEVKTEDKQNAETGIEGVAVIAGVALLATGAIIVSRKKK